MRNYLIEFCDFWQSYEVKEIDVIYWNGEYRRVIRPTPIAIFKNRSDADKFIEEELKQQAEDVS